MLVTWMVLFAALFLLNAAPMYCNQQFKSNLAEYKSCRGLEFGSGGGGLVQLLPGVGFDLRPAALGCLSRLLRLLERGGLCRLGFERHNPGLHCNVENLCVENGEMIR